MVLPVLFESSFLLAIFLFRKVTGLARFCVVTRREREECGLPQREIPKCLPTPSC